MNSTRFRYRAIDRSGNRLDGTLSASDEPAARRQLLTSIALIEELKPVRFVSPIPTVRSADLAQGLRMLSTLLASGLSMQRVLSVYQDMAPSGWRESWPDVKRSVQQGHSLSEALRASDLRIPPDLLGIIAAGDSGAGLALAVARAAEVAERQARARGDIQNALAYPMLLLLVGTATMVVLLTSIIPRFAAIIEDLGEAVPPSTRLLISIGEFVRLATLPGLVTLALVAIVASAWLRTEEGRARAHEWLLQLPIIGPLRRASATAGTLATLAALLEGGVPLAVAMTRVESASSDRAIARRLARSRQAIARGESLAQALSQADAITATSARCVKAGEESGRLREMLSQASAIEAALVSRAIRNLTRLLEPVLILVFGLGTAGVAVALLQAVYAVRPQ